MKHRVYKAVAVAFVVAVALTVFVASGSAATRPNPFLQRGVHTDPYMGRTVHPDPCMSRGIMDAF
jgi:hypothetical protein